MGILLRPPFNTLPPTTSSSPSLSHLISLHFGTYQILLGSISDLIVAVPRPATHGSSALLQSLIFHFHPPSPQCVSRILTSEVFTVVQFTEFPPVPVQGQCHTRQNHENRQINVSRPTQIPQFARGVTSGDQS